jgi:hypothetical protein
MITRIPLRTLYASAKSPILPRALQRCPNSTNRSSLLWSNLSSNNITANTQRLNLLHHKLEDQAICGLSFQQVSTTENPGKLFQLSGMVAQFPPPPSPSFFTQCSTVAPHTCVIPKLSDAVQL